MVLEMVSVERQCQQCWALITVINFLHSVKVRQNKKDINEHFCSYMRIVQI